jgi:hypothetical protein
MHDIVQHGHLEDAKQHGAGFMSGKGHGAVVGGDSRDEPEDSNQQENRTNNHGGVVKRQPHRVVLGGV